MKTLKLGNLEIPIPIVQGGMGVGISCSSLASSVANEGGIGVISAAGLWMLNPKFAGKGQAAAAEAVKEEIRIAKSKTKGVLGINIMVALSNFEDLAYAAIEEKIDIIFAGAGLPLKLPRVLEKARKNLGDNIQTKLVPIISSAKAASLITRTWIEKENYAPDAFVLEGPMAGGHLGFKADDIFKEEFKLENLVVEVKAELKKIEEKYGHKIPLIAGGGIFTGQDIKRIMALGADAVQMGTRFVATKECDADIKFKNAYVDCKEEDIVIIQSPVGLPGRSLKNSFTEKAKEGKLSPKKCPFHCITTCKMEEAPYCISLALVNSCNGRLDNGFAFIGAKGYMVDKIVSVKELINTLKIEFESGG